MNIANLTKRQEEILSAALKLVANEGTRALTMKRVAEELNVTEPAIYRHFKNKRHLLLALYGYVRDLLIAELEPILRQRLSARDRLILFVETLLAYLTKRKGVNLILLAETIYHQDEQLRKAMLDIFLGVRELAAELIQQGVESGTFQPKQKPTKYATCLLGMIQGFLTFYMLDSEMAVDTNKASKAILDCFLEPLEIK